MCRSKDTIEMLSGTRQVLSGPRLRLGVDSFRLLFMADSWLNAPTPMHRPLVTLLLSTPFLIAATCDYQTELRPMGGAEYDVSADLTGDAPLDVTAVPDVEEVTDVDRCDLNGLWAIRQVAFSQDTILGAVQVSSEWYVTQITDLGDDVVVESSYACGVEVSGSASVLMVPEAVPSVLFANPWDGRRGEFSETDDACELSLEMHYTALGVERSDYVPMDGSLPTLVELGETHPLPTMEDPTGAQDWDEDGIPGFAYRVSGAVSGKRHVVQRYRWRYYSDEGLRAQQEQTEFFVRAEIETEESILAIEGCDPFCGLLETGSITRPGARHRAHFRRLGDSLEDAETNGEVILAEDALESCFRLREAMPHDPDVEP